MTGAFTGLAVAILSLIYTFAAADAGSARTKTSVVTSVTPTHSGGGGSSLILTVQRNLHFGGYGTTYGPNQPMK